MLPNIRVATAADSTELFRLAAATGRRLRGHVLVAEREDHVIAAIELTSGLVLGDPSQPDGEAAQLLKSSRYQVLRQSGGVGQTRSRLRRLTPAAAA